MTTGHCPCTCHANGAYGVCSIEGGCGHLHDSAGAPCVVCCRPTHDAAICPVCDGQLIADLKAIPELWADLDTARARQHRFAARNGGRSADTPLPVNQRAADTARRLSFALCRAALETVDRAGIPSCPSSWGHPPEVAAWLLRWRGHLRQLPDGCFVRAIRSAVRTARNTVDIPMDRRTYLGECIHPIDHNRWCDPDCDQHPQRCGHQLYAIKGEPYAECPRCLSLYDVPETRTDQREVIRHEVAPARLLAGMLTDLGVPVTARDIHGLARAQLIEPAGSTSDNYRTYRAGDVLDALDRRAEAG